MARRDRIPNPPFSVGRQTVSQLTLALRWVWGFAFHKNFWVRCYIWHRLALGSLKTDIAWEGIADRVDLVRTCLPGKESSRLHHVSIWLAALVTIGARLWVLERPVQTGKPRYLSVGPIVARLSWLTSANRRCAGTLGAKMTLDLDQFIVCPAAEANWAKLF